MPWPRPGGQWNRTASVRRWGRQSHPTVYLAWLDDLLQTHSRPTNPQSGLTAKGCLACADPLATSIAPVYAPKGPSAWSLVPPGRTVPGAPPPLSAHCPSAGKYRHLAPTAHCNQLAAASVPHPNLDSTAIPWPAQAPLVCLPSTAKNKTVPSLAWRRSLRFSSSCPHDSTDHLNFSCLLPLWFSFRD